MDNDSPAARVERTFWSVWYYITGAVNRFFRAEPENIVTDESNSLQESSVDNQPANCSLAEDDASGREVDEEQTLMTPSVFKSSQSVVAWELCATDIGSGPDEDTAESNDQLSSEEQLIRTGKDATLLDVAEDAREDEREESKVFAHGQDEKQEDVECEERLAVASEDMEEGTEEETKRVMMTDDQQKMDEMATEIKVKEEGQLQQEGEQDLTEEDTEEEEEEDDMNSEEAMVQGDEDDQQNKDETMAEVNVLGKADQKYHKDEEDLMALDVEVDEEDSMDSEDSEVQSDKTDTATTDDQQKMDETMTELKVGEKDNQIHSEDEQDLKSDDIEVKEDDMCGEVAKVQSDETDTAVTDDPEILFDTMTEVKFGGKDDQKYHKDEEDLMALDTEVDEEDNMHSVEAKVQIDKVDTAVTDEQKILNTTITEVKVRGEDNQMHSNDEQDLKGDNTEEEEDDMSSEEVQSDEADTAVTDDPHNSDETVTEVKCEGKDNQTHNKDEQDLKGEDIEVKLSMINLVENAEICIEEAKEQSDKTTEDQQNLDDSVTEVKVEEDDEQMHHEDKQDLKVEDVEVKLSLINLEETADRCIEEAKEQSDETDTAATDDQQNLDDSVTEVKAGENDDQMHHEDEQDLKVEDVEVEEDNMYREEAKVQSDEAVTAATDDPQNLHENDDQMQLKYEPDLKGEDDEVKLFVITLEERADATMTEVKFCGKADQKHHKDEVDLMALDIEVDEENNMHTEEAKRQSEEADAALTDEEAEDSSDVLLLASANENKCDEGAKPHDNQLSVREELLDDDADSKGDPCFTSLHVRSQTADDKSFIVSEDELTIAGQEHVMPRGSESDKVKDESALEERGEAAEHEREAREEDDVKSLTEEDFSTGLVKFSDEVLQDAETEEVRDVEREDTKSWGEVIVGEPDMDTTDFPIDDKSFDKDHVEEERITSELAGKESYMKEGCTSVTVKPEGKNGQEISGEFKNIPPGICEGRLVVSRELNSPACEETQEGVPEYNNEPGPDENTTRGFLEVGESVEIQTLQLPEEVESKEVDCLQKQSVAADCLLVREHMEEEQGGAEDIKDSFGLVVQEQETETPLIEAVSQESRLSFEEEEGKLLVDSMKTGIENSETHFGLTRDETTEELLVEFDKDESLCDFKEAGASEENETLKFLEAEAQKMTEISFFETGMHSEQSSCTMPSLLKESENKLPEYRTEQMQDTEEAGYGVEEEATEAGVQSNNEMVARMSELTTERTEKENTLITESMTQTQFSDEALEINKQKTEETDESSTSESKPKHFTVISAEDQTKHSEKSPISNCPDVIDDEILDLWIQTAMSEDTDGITIQERPECDHELSKQKEEVEISSAQELVESKSGESELVSDAEMSSSTAESGFSDHSLCEWAAPNSETQPLKSTTTALCDMLADESADVSELSTQQPNFESQEAAKIDPSDVKEDTGLSKAKRRKTKQTEETRSLQETEVMNQTEQTERKDATEAKSLTEMSDLFKVQDTKDEDEPVSDSPDEIGHAHSRSGSEGIVSTESGSDDDVYTENQNRLLKLPSLDKADSEVDSLPGPNQPEEGGEPALEGWIEVDDSVLDFTAQRSRIAVKNPRVRPPKDPRSLLHMPSVDPTPSSHLPVKAPIGMPLGGLGIGIKLPGLGAGFPVLKKTQRIVRSDENTQETTSQEPETKPEEKSDAPKQDEPQAKPKWMPPRHPGFGNPLMSELKTKLKKTTKE